jgi:hypothetical protein
MVSIQLLKKKAVDLAKLEGDVAAALPLPISRTPSVQSEPMPEYVEHQNGVPRAAALSAEAVVRDYETAEGNRSNGS